MLYQGYQVQLKSGGPVMTVVGSVHNSDVGAYVTTVIWFDSTGVLHQAEILASLLNVIS